jgi:hypothetical protein
LTTTVLIFIVSALFTWSVGLAPPLIIRFLIVKHPLDKPWPLVLSVVFFIFNLVLFTGLGSESKGHLALFLIAWASYTIYRGPRKLKEGVLNE